MKKKFNTQRGHPSPFGTTKFRHGINFALFSKHAETVSLCLFEPKKTEPFCEIPFNSHLNKTGDVWHIFVAGLPESFDYGYRIDGPYEPLKGLYFDNRTILLDPYAKKTATRQKWGSGLLSADNHVHTASIYPIKFFDWKEDAHPRIPFKDLIIYEMHVRGFTQDSTSDVEKPGTFLGLIEKIPHLVDLGINAVELMPIHEFNELDNLNRNPQTDEPLVNYWGYSTINFFAPMNRYGSPKGCAVQEFKTMVRALHAEGIEVILDVVYNHTAEGNQKGPLISFKGFENPVYYLLGPNGEYYNFSGCGNTFNCNHPVVRELILESLRYWVTEMHVDGFRFDLASILTRSHDGISLQNPPLIDAITHDPILADTKLIAEAWDAGGLYQVGSFPGAGVWSEWNGKFRDTVRRFLKGDAEEVGNFATRICGSSDLYGDHGSPRSSINFVCAHDGFTLADLVSYNQKRNLENGEDNRDGTNQNDSWNCGIEGPTEDPQILKLRERQMKNFVLALFISQGVPMFLMGDEYGHTKFGNNNSWGLDSRINWFQWDTLVQNKAFFRFCKSLIHFRKEHPILARSQFLEKEDITWHGIEPGNPDWSQKSHILAFTLPDNEQKYALYVAFNTYHEPVTFHLPARSNGTEWKCVVDTARDFPQDFVVESKRSSLASDYTLQAYSAIMLKAHDL